MSQPEYPDYRAPQEQPAFGQTPVPGPQYGQSPTYGQAPQYGQSPTYGQPPQYGQAPSDVQDHYGAHYGQAPYGQVPPSGYGQQVSSYQPYGQPAYAYGGMQQEHPQSTSVLVLGILGWFVPVVSFVAWYMGGKAKKEIQAGAPFNWGGGLKIGYILGVVCSVLWIVVVALYILILVASLLFMATF